MDKMISKAVGYLLTLLFLTGCATSVPVTPESYGARAGEDGAKYWKEQNPGIQPSTDSAGIYCANMAEDGGKQYGWSLSEIAQAGDSCSIWFSTELFRK
jgi:hypothetical protein